MKKLLVISKGEVFAGTEKVVYTLIKELSHNWNITLLTQDGVLAQKLELSGTKIDITIIPKINFNPLNLIKIFYIIGDKVYSKKIKIIHSHHRLSTVISTVFNLLNKSEVLHTMHYPILNKRAFNYLGNNVVCVSQALTTNLKQESPACIQPKNITYIYNSIPPLIRNRDTESIYCSHRPKQLLFVGRISEQKGLKYLLEAISIIKINMRKNNASLTILGDGDQLTEMKELAKKLNVTNIVNFKGFVNNVTDYLNNCYSLILPSLWEGLPVIIQEAFSIGVPVIATNVDGTPEIVSDHYNGLLVAPKSPSQLAQAINQFLEHPQIVKGLGENALTTYNELFSSGTMVKQYEKIYKELYAKE